MQAGEQNIRPASDAAKETKEQCHSNKTERKEVAVTLVQMGGREDQQVWPDIWQSFGGSSLNRVVMFQ